MARVFCVGHAVQDFVFAVRALPDRGQKYRADGFQSVGGGPAATAAVTISKLGGHAVLAARVGDDAVADILAAELRHYGVDCTWVRRFAGCGSPVSAVMVDARGERMIVNHLDASLPPDTAWLPELAAVEPDAVLADVRWPEGAALALTRARAAGLPAVLDADQPVPPDGVLLRTATHVAFSREGLLQFAGDDDVERALRRVASDLGGWCCVTLGGEGCFVMHHGNLERLAAYRVPVVDTLGAGDVWHGAFALALAERRGERAAVAFASAAAALKVQQFGGRAGAPVRADVERFIAARVSAGECP
jgi:sulfofructose kinase